MPLLSWLIFLPLIGALLCWLAELLGRNIPRYVALITMLLTLVLTIALYLQGGFVYDAVSAYGKNSSLFEWQSEFSVPWINILNIKFHLALDGLSLLMVLLTAFMGVISVCISWRETYPRPGFFYFNLVLTVAGVMGVFTAIDLFLFFFFWELMLLPMYLMIAIWGHKSSSEVVRFNGATKFLLYTQLSGLILLVAISTLVWVQYTHTGKLSFDYPTLLQYMRLNPLTETANYLLMLGFFIAFAVKMPIFPLHSWLADAHEQAPTAGSIDITGLLLKTAAYGLLRFCLPLFPEASAQFAPIAMTLGLIGLFYGAWLAFMQTDIKRLIAYTSVSHMGLVTIAIYSGNLLAYQGAVIQMIAHGLSAAGLFIVSALLYERLQTRDMRKMGGLWKKIQYLPAVTLFFAVATLGLPGTGNFVGEFMMLLGSFSVVPIVIDIAAFAMVFASIYALMMIQRIYFGTPASDEPLSKLHGGDYLILASLIMLLLAIGLYPQWILDLSYSAMNNVQIWFNTAQQVSTLTTG